MPVVSVPVVSVPVDSVAAVSVPAESVAPAHDVILPPVAASRRAGTGEQAGVRAWHDNGGMADALQVRPGLVVPGDELVERFSRSSGPGGQSVNTADSRVELRFDVAGSRALPASVKERLLRRLAARLVGGTVVVVASEHRSQLRNREAARARLAALVRSALAPSPPPRRPTRPSRTAREERLAAKRRRADTKRRRRAADADD